jgi:hypothetical protein
MTTTKLPTTPDGWILGTDCGYPNHAGFVKDAGKMLWSLTPAAGSDTLWVLALIDNGVAISQRTMSLEAAVAYAR